MDFPTETVFVRADLRVPRTLAEKSAWETLTPRKHAVALLVARGLSNAEVAQELKIGESTVEGYLNEVYPALGIRSRTELANFVRDMTV